MHQLEFELADYLRWSGSIAGLRSVHGALVDMALSGAYGAHAPSSPEDRWDARRRDRVRSCAVVSDALRKLDARPRDVLLSAFAPLDWKGVVDQRFGKGRPFEELHRRVGDRIGVALLTDRVRHGFEKERDRTATVFGATVREVRLESDAHLRTRLRAATGAGGAAAFDDVEGPMLDACGTFVGVERDITHLECYRLPVPPAPDAPAHDAQHELVWNTPLGWLVGWAIVDDKKLRPERDEVLGDVKAEAWDLFKSAMKAYAGVRQVELPEFEDERRERERKEREDARVPREATPRRAHKPEWFKSGSPPPTPRMAEVEVVA